MGPEHASVSWLHSFIMAESPDRRRDYVKFNGINFPQWKFAVMLKLKKKKLDAIVLGTETKPVEVICNPESYFRTIDPQIYFVMYLTERNPYALVPNLYISF